VVCETAPILKAPLPTRAPPAALIVKGLPRRLPPAASKGRSPAAQDNRLAERAATYHHGGWQPGEIRSGAETEIDASKGEAAAQGP
jgi:hypothetical protein